MIIDSIIMEGYKAYKDRTEIKLKSGLTIINGRSGTGKSSLLDLIALLLLDKADQDYGSLLNWNSNQLYTEMNFTHGDKFKITFEYSKSDTAKVGKSVRKLFKNDMTTPIAEGDNAKALLAELFNPLTTDAGLFFKQDSRPFIDMGDSERLTLLKKIQQVELNEEILEIENYIKGLTVSITELDKQIYSIENKQYDFKTISELPYSEADIESLKKDITILSKEVESADALVSEKKELEDKIKIAKYDISELEKALVSTKSLLASKTEAKDKFVSEGTLAKTTEVSKELKELSEKVILNNSENITSNFNATKNSIEAKINELTESKSNYSVARIIKFDDSKLNAVINSIADIKALIRTETKALELCKQGKCSECGREYKNTDTESHSAIIENNNNLLKEKESELQVCQSEKEAYALKLETNESNKNKVIQIDNAISAEKEKLENYSDDKLSKLLETEKLRIANEEANKNKLMDMKHIQLEGIESSFQSQIKLFDSEILRYSEDIANKQTNLDNLNITLLTVSTKFDSIQCSDVTESKNKLSTLRKNIDNYVSVKAVNESNEKHNDALTLVKEKDSIELQKLYSSKNEILLDKVNHETAKTVLSKDFPNYVVGKVVKNIQNHMNDFIDKIYRKPLNIELTSSKSGVPLLYGNGKRKIPAKSGLSGAEKSIVQLSFNNIFNQKNKLECILIDESDSATDELTSKDLFKSIGNMLSVYKQMIIISHNNNMKDYMTATYSANVVNIGEVE